MTAVGLRHSAHALKRATHCNLLCPLLPAPCSLLPAMPRPNSTRLRWFIDHWRATGLLLFVLLCAGYVTYSSAVSQRIGMTTRPGEVARETLTHGRSDESPGWIDAIVAPSTPRPRAWIPTSQQVIGSPIPLVALLDYDVFFIDQPATAARADGAVEVARARLLHSRVPLLDWHYHWVPGQWRYGVLIPDAAFATKGRASMTVAHPMPGMFWRQAMVVLLLCMSVVYGLDRAVVTRERRRRAAGCCAACGHSRQGITSSAPCTECGAAASPDRPRPPLRLALLGAAAALVLTTSVLLGLWTLGWPFDPPSREDIASLRPFEISREWSGLGQVGWPTPMVQWSVSNPLDAPEDRTCDGYGPVSDQTQYFPGESWFRPGVPWALPLRPWFNSQRESVSACVYVDSIVLHGAGAVLLWWILCGLPRGRSTAARPPDPHADPLPTPITSAHPAQSE